MCSLFINDLDAGAGRMGSSTQYTVNNQMVNATLMNIADNPTNVQLPGVYKVTTLHNTPPLVHVCASEYGRPLLVGQRNGHKCHWLIYLATRRALAVDLPPLDRPRQLCCSLSFGARIDKSQTQFFHACAARGDTPCASGVHW